MEELKNYTVKLLKDLQKSMLDGGLKREFSDKVNVNVDVFKIYYDYDHESLIFLEISNLSNNLSNTTTISPAYFVKMTTDEINRLVENVICELGC